MFFPVQRTRGDDAIYASAIAVCRSCPVQVDCHRFAVQMGTACGVWGGRVFDPIHPGGMSAHSPGVTLRQWRTARCMTQEEAARFFQTEQSRISEWENGRRKVPANVASILGVSSGG